MVQCSCVTHLLDLVSHNVCHMHNYLRYTRLTVRMRQNRRISNCPMGSAPFFPTFWWLNTHPTQKGRMPAFDMATGHLSQHRANLSGGLGVEAVFARSCSFFMDRQVLFSLARCGNCSFARSTCGFAAQAQCFGRLRVRAAVPVGFAIQGWSF